MTSKIVNQILIGIGLIAMFVTALSFKNDTTKTIKIENEVVILEFSLEGSAFTRFEYHGKEINPLAWQLPNSRMPETNIGGYDFRGHFLCLGTWGMPTEGEKKAGLKFYGEVNTEKWSVLSGIEKSNGIQEIVTSCLSPVEKLNVKRTIQLYDGTSLVKVSEEITNKLPIGRPYNILQHATFGGDFINQKTILNTNAGKGFYQNGKYKRKSYADIEETSYEWPMAIFPDDEIDLRLSNQTQKTYVSSHIFPETAPLGWATLANREEGILMGYVWDKNDYPWLNVWYQYEENEVKGRAIEFATCGMWQSFEYMMSTDSRFFGQNSFEFIDAEETKTKSYHMFLLPISNDFSEVEEVKQRPEGIVIRWKEKDKMKTKILAFKED